MTLNLIILRANAPFNLTDGKMGTILTVNAILLMKLQQSPGHSQVIIHRRRLHPRIKRKGAQSYKEISASQSHLYIIPGAV